MEVLSPLVSVLGRFKEQYKSFAASLDATRHELPIRNIHIEGDKPTYLGMKISFHLSSTLSQTFFYMFNEMFSKSLKL